MRVNYTWLILAGLITGCLLSAIAVVYSVDRYHRLANQRHDLNMHMGFLQTQRSQLLLEYSTLTSPIRIQNIAQKRLHMHQPHSNETRIIYAQKQKPE